MAIYAQVQNLKVKQKSDIFLTKKFAEAGFSPLMIQTLNKCRIYLQATTLTDITDGSGNNFCPYSWKGVRDIRHIKHHDWPNQGNPDSNSWRKWRSALRNIIPKTGGSLICWLGPWVDCRRNGWTWFASESTRRIYRRVGNGWLSYKRGKDIGNLRKGNNFQTDVCVSIPPSDLCRSTINETGQDITLTGWSPDAAIHHNHTKPISVTPSWIVQ